MSLGAFGDEGNAAPEPHCSDCGDPFHFDDCGGYNPPCNCGKCDGMLCRACCRAELYDDEEAVLGGIYPDDIGEELHDG